MIWWRRIRPVHRREVILYTREGCHLCEAAHAVLEQAQQRVSFDLRLIDIGGNEELEGLYGLEIPVVVIDGQVRFRGHVNPVLLRRQLGS